ncbi:MAG: YdeI/OmpD-associated family protein [Actinomycetota bacterium]|nr:YdeI/OmpD-associated family protein [Actinomycetota bacterium]
MASLAAILEVMAMHGGLPILELRDRKAWGSWLHANHASLSGVWLKLAKKGSPKPTVTYAEALEEAIRYGWIDGQRRAYDEQSYLQRFTVRGPRSAWSQINRDKALALIAEGRMADAGLAKIRAAQEDGRWERAYEPQSRATVPEDFRRELDRNPSAKQFFETLTGSRRYAFLYRLHNTRGGDARAKRIAMYIELLSARKTLQD